MIYNTPKDPCKQGREHRGLTDSEKLDRNKAEQRLRAAGKPLGYKRSDKQAAAAARAVAEAAPADGGKGGGKGGKGKGKSNNKCWHHLDKPGSCPHGQNCWFKANTPGHP